VSVWSYLLTLAPNKQYTPRQKNIHLPLPVLLLILAHRLLPPVSRMMVRPLQTMKVKAAKVLAIQDNDPSHILVIKMDKMKKTRPPPSSEEADMKKSRKRLRRMDNTDTTSVVCALIGKLTHELCL
jgi:hypothetical protein